MSEGIRPLRLLIVALTMPFSSVKVLPLSVTMTGSFAADLAMTGAARAEGPSTALRTDRRQKAQSRRQNGEALILACGVRRWPGMAKRTARTLQIYQAKSLVQSLVVPGSFAGRLRATFKLI